MCIVKGNFLSMCVKFHYHLDTLIEYTECFVDHLLSEYTVIHVHSQNTPQALIWRWWVWVVDVM